ncbi:transglutaminase domain-containing protein [Clostridium pasteurianum]|uniref:Transglutaminase-like enzyme, predicted cysteine protease n=1 Tax=Clostridium pasteurianum BC1 TaxID=86416 RepID=R4KAN0_CLOPA|nr:transglutaminase domain-containing protein [Clostridium pasteurianum]AGK99618.1 transglutaminase-like enzyme, predicted cysteine protease [Clostridium pasteurianum BC1]
MDLKIFLQENKYIDFSSQIIQSKSHELFRNINSNTEKAKIAFEYVRDEIPHSFDIQARIITAKASDVLKYKTGICHAKANLLAALLRTQSIPTGMCFQHITLAADDSMGYCVHCFNAIFIDNKWIKVDARGNTNGKNAQFSLEKPLLAFQNRKQYDEYFWNGIYANPHEDTMTMLEGAATIQDIIEHIPDYVIDEPDIIEQENFKACSQ